MNIIKLIQEIKVRLNSPGLNLDLYLFGSILYNEKCYSDIDVLVIYNCFSELDVIKYEFAELSKKIPIDLYCMTPEEESELEFVKRTNAVKI